MGSLLTPTLKILHRYFPEDKILNDKDNEPLHRPTDEDYADNFGIPHQRDEIMSGNQSVGALTHIQNSYGKTFESYFVKNGSNPIEQEKQVE